MGLLHRMASYVTPRPPSIREERLDVATLTAGGAGMRILKRTYVSFPDFPIRRVSASFDPSAKEAANKLDVLKEYVPHHQTFNLTLAREAPEAYGRNPLLSAYDLHVLLTYKAGDPRVVKAADPLQAEAYARAHAIVIGQPPNFTRLVDFLASMNGGTGLGFQLALLPFIQDGRSPYGAGEVVSTEGALSLRKRHWFISGIWGRTLNDTPFEFANAVAALGLYDHCEPTDASAIWFDNESLLALTGRGSSFWKSDRLIGRMRLCLYRAWDRGLGEEQGFSIGGTITLGRDSAIGQGGGPPRQGTMGYARVPRAVGATRETVAQKVSEAIQRNACGYPVSALARQAATGTIAERPVFLVFITAPARMTDWIEEAAHAGIERSGISRYGARIWHEHAGSDEVEIVVHIAAPGIIPMGLVQYYVRHEADAREALNSAARRNVEEARAAGDRARSYSNVIETAITRYGYNTSSATMPPNGYLARGLEILKDNTSLAQAPGGRA